MHKRHPDNTHLKLHYEPYWNGLPVQTEHGPLIDNYLSRIYETLCYSLQEFLRTCVIRFDLRFPLYWPQEDTAVISRFFHELTWQLIAAQRLAENEGKRVFPNTLRYLWAKEIHDSLNWHYHVAIALNKDAFFSLGHYPTYQELRSPTWKTDVGTSMIMRIILAWAKALNMPPDQVAGTVWFPQDCVYQVNGNSPEYAQQFGSAFHRVSYLAKVSTKGYGTRANNFGCSRK